MKRGIIVAAVLALAVWLAWRFLTIGTDPYREKGILSSSTRDTEGRSALKEEIRTEETPDSSGPLGKIADSPTSKPEDDPEQGSRTERPALEINIDNGIPVPAISTSAKDNLDAKGIRRVLRQTSLGRLHEAQLTDEQVLSIWKAVEAERAYYRETRESHVLAFGAWSQAFSPNPEDSRYETLQEAEDALRRRHDLSNGLQNRIARVVSTGESGFWIAVAQPTKDIDVYLSYQEWYFANKMLERRLEEILSAR